MHCWTPNSTGGMIYEQHQFTETRKPQGRTGKPRSLTYMNYGEIHGAKTHAKLVVQQKNMVKNVFCTAAQTTGGLK